MQGFVKMRASKYAKTWKTSHSCMREYETRNRKSKASFSVRIRFLGLTVFEFCPFQDEGIGATLHVGIKIKSL